MRTIAIAAVAILAVAVGAFSLTRSGDESEYLRALKADSMARYAPPGVRLVRSSETDERAGGGFSKQQEARLTRVLAVPAAAAEGAVAAAADAARAAGWIVRDAIVGTGVTGTKRLPSGRASISILLTISRAQLPTGIEGPAVTIGLRHARS